MALAGVPNSALAQERGVGEADADSADSPTPGRSDDTSAETKSRDSDLADDLDDPPDAPEPAPPPPAPKATDQALAPYTRAPQASEPLRNLEIGPLAGIAWRGSASSDASYDPGPLLGASCRINLARWLGLRGYVAHSRHPVSAEPSDLGIVADELDQPALGVTLIAARFEPSYWLSERARLFIAVGAGWAHVTADRLSTRGGTEVELGTRFGATTEVGGAVGGSYDVVEHWLSLSISLSGAATTSTSGKAFEPRQAFTANGEIVQVGALPELAGSLSAWVGLELLL